MSPAAPVWIVAGAPGAGKSTVAEFLLRHLRPTPAMLDKDVLFAGFVDEVQDAHGKPRGEREGSWYDQHVKAHEYRGMTEAAAQVRAPGCPVVLVAPFTTQIRNPDVWSEWVADLGGDPVHLVWVSLDAETLRQRIIARASPRDAGKLDDWEAFVARMQPDTPPPVPHHRIDASGAPADVERQVLALITPNTGVS